MPAYVDFRKYLQDNLPLLDTFKKIFQSISEEKRSVETPNRKQKCRWYSELIFIEINEVYHIWYDTHPIEQVNRLITDLKKYLLQKYPNYYNRIHKWQTGGHLK